MREAFVGFDSAWSIKNKGAICHVVYQGNSLEEVCLPKLSSFDEAGQIIRDLQKECQDVLVAIDQPIIVCNRSGSRCVDRIARRLIHRLRSGVQSANRTGKPNKAALFGDEAPIWGFINEIGPSGDTGTAYDGACNPLLDFEAAKTSTGQSHLIEVYPALALPALEPKIMERNLAARYNPRRKTFCLADWRLVCQTVRRCGDELGLQPLSKWAEEVAALTSPELKKPDQDKIDAAICLVIALQLRRYRERYGLTAIGDQKTGYMVTPTSLKKQSILQGATD